MKTKENGRTNAVRHRIARYSAKILLDVLALLIATVLAVYVGRTEALTLVGIPCLLWIAVHLVIMLLAFLTCSIYRLSYRAFGVLDCMRLGVAFVLIGASEFLVAAFAPFVEIVHAFIYFLVFCALAFVIRVTYRLRGTLWMRHSHRSDKKRVVIVGAGAAGLSILRELQNTDKIDYLPVAVLDDDPSKQGMYICGVKVVGTIDSCKETVQKYNANHIFVAMPSVAPARLKDVYAKCQLAGVTVQTLPGLYQLAAGTVSVSKMRNVEPQDLLGREQIKVNLDEIMGYIEDRVVLVTGGGGSIGSELCRQIATQRPRQLIIFDIYENNAYDIEQELRRKHAALNLLVLIGSVRDKGKIEDVFSKYKPNIVFNAAAHKHVPLMETSPCEAVKNNVFGTLNVARAADRHGVERFVQISTDKAVNPTNIMGATKRICEMIIQSIGRTSKTEFVAVRFGNVLGSNGSVIPLFKRQIAEGGPVTVTHKDIIRYFMTIPEAVSLVLQAGAYAKNGEIFVLDMGEQVRIYDLAENLIRMSGYEPGVDIEIVCTGLRPGEKLYEERLMDEEGMQKTANNSISIGKPIEFDENVFYEKLDRLYEAAYAETEEMKELVHELVPTYTVDKR